MQNEIWKDVKSYEGIYMVSNQGVIKSLDRLRVRPNGGSDILKGRVIKQNISAKGYARVSLFLKGKYKTLQIHQLMAESFLGHKRCGHKMIVDHIDNNKQNNTLSNLQLITQRSNCIKELIGSNMQSKYIGVSPTSSGRFSARIRINGKKKQIGVFDTEIEASNAYNNELSKLR